MRKFAELCEEKCYLEQESVKGVVGADQKLAEIVKEIEMIKKSNNVKEINVFYEEGYKWSVDVVGEEESRVSNVNKVEAVRIAKEIKKIEFNGNVVVNVQVLSKKEKSENMKYLHGNTETFHDDFKYKS